VKQILPKRNRDEIDFVSRKRRTALPHARRALCAVASFLTPRRLYLARYDAGPDEVGSRVRNDIIPPAAPLSAHRGGFLNRLAADFANFAAAYAAAFPGDVASADAAICLRLERRTVAST
jgi:hypothetical protein